MTNSFYRFHVEKFLSELYLISTDGQETEKGRSLPSIKRKGLRRNDTDKLVVLRHLNSDRVKA